MPLCVHVERTEPARLAAAMTRQRHALAGRTFAALFGLAASMPGIAEPTTMAAADVTHQTSSVPTLLLAPIVRTGDISFDAIVSFYTEDGSAIAGVDYTAASADTLMPAGAAIGGAEISAAGNTTSYSSVTFGVRLAAATGIGPVAAFDNPQELDTPQQVGPIATASLSHDGRKDLILSSGSFVYVKSFVSLPYGPAVQTTCCVAGAALGSSPLAIAAADLNGDGKQDLVAANNAEATLSVALNTSDRSAGSQTLSFATRQAFATVSDPTSIAIADFNNDGKPDLAAVGSGASGVSLLLNTTSTGAALPSFATQQVFTASSALRLKAADINGDGRIDLVTSAPSVLLNTTAYGAASASFATEQPFPVANVLAFEVADINSDGKTDLITRGGTLKILLNATAPGASQANFSAALDVPSPPQALLAIADVNVDGKPDLISADQDLTAISVHINRTIPGATRIGFASAQTFERGPNHYAITTLDANGDGRPDFATTYLGDLEYSVFVNSFDWMGGTSNNASFAAAQAITTGDAPSDVTTADIDGDGRLDLIVADGADNALSVRVNTTPPGTQVPSYATRQSFPTGDGDHVVVADINGDGRGDLIATDVPSTGVAVRLNNGAAGVTPSFASAQIFATGAATSAVAVADFNGDGRRDLVVAHAVNASIATFLNTSAPGATSANFSGAQAFACGSVPTSVVTADVNRDGRSDVITLNSASGNVSVLVNTTAPGAASTSFATQLTFNAVSDPARLITADINGDGDADLIVADPTNQAVAVLRNITALSSSTPNFAAPVSFPAGLTPLSITSADLNGDGKPDLAVAGSNAAAVLINNGNLLVAPPPSFKAPLVLAAGAGAAAITASDVNSDGLADLLVADTLADTVSVLFDSRLRVDIVDDNGSVTLLHGRIFANGFE